MAIGSLAQEHRIVEWDRPAEVVPLQEQLDRGGQTNYMEHRPGPWAEARCACGWIGSGPAEIVMSEAREHVGFVQLP